MIKIREGVTQGDLFLVDLYRLTLFSPSEYFPEKDPGVLQTLYADDVTMLGLVEKNARLLYVMMEKGTFHRYFPDPEKS